MDMSAISIHRLSNDRNEIILFIVPLPQYPVIRNTKSMGFDLKYFRQKIALLFPFCKWIEQNLIVLDFVSFFLKEKVKQHWTWNDVQWCSWDVFSVQKPISSSFAAETKWKITNFEIYILKTHMWNLFTDIALAEKRWEFVMCAHIHSIKCL